MSTRCYRIPHTAELSKMNAITRSADVKPAGLNELVLCCMYCVSGWVGVVMMGGRGGG